MSMNSYSAIFSIQYLLIAVVPYGVGVIVLSNNRGGCCYDGGKRCLVCSSGVH